MAPKFLVPYQMVVEKAEGLSAPGVALLDGPADLRDGGHRRHRRLHVVPHLVQRQVAALLLLTLQLRGRVRKVVIHSTYIRISMFSCLPKDK